MHVIENQLESLFQKAGCQSVPKNIIIDGKKKRIPLDSEDLKKSLEYCISKHDSEEALSFRIQIRNYKNGFHLDQILLPDTEISEEQVEAIYESFQEAQKDKDHESLIRYETKALEAQKKWDQAKKEGSSDYLQSKSITNVEGLRYHLGSALIPIHDHEGKIWSLQSLSLKGKYMLPGSKVSGNFFHFKGPKDGDRDPEMIYICEGFATGWSLWKSLNSNLAQVVVAFSSTNLSPVAQSHRDKYPDSEIILAGDTDEVGRKKATEAAEKVHGRCLFPPFDFTHPDHTDWNDYQRYYGEGPTRMKLLDFKAEPKLLKLSRQEWLLQWLTKEKIEVFHSGYITKGGKQTDFDKLFHEIFCEQEQKSLKISSALITSFLFNYIAQKREEATFNLKDPLFQGEYHPWSEEIGAFLKAITGEIDPIHFKMLQHFIWIVKRKMLGQPIAHHIMPILWNPRQGMGKSYSIYKLLSPLGDLSKTSDMTIFSDKRDWDLFENHYVIFVDEMAKINRVDVDSLKKIITESQITYRAPYGRTPKSIQNKASFIGTSNNDPEDILRDTTGNRRFWAIKSSDVIDQESINKIDYLKIWQSVDPLSECLISDILPEMRAHQETYRAKSPVESWIEDRGAEDTSQVEDGFSPTRALFEDFSDYLKESYSGKVPFVYHSNTFGRQLSHLGYKRSRNKNINGFTIRIPKVQYVFKS